MSFDALQPTFDSTQTGVSMTTATLHWVPPTLNTDGSPITGAITYNVYQGAAANSMTKVQSGLTSPTAVITTGLTPGTTEFFSVSAVVSGQEGAQEVPVSAAIPALIPNAPTGLTVVLS